MTRSVLVSLCVFVAIQTPAVLGGNAMSTAEVADKPSAVSSQSLMTYSALQPGVALNYEVEAIDEYQSDDKAAITRDRVVGVIEIKCVKVEDEKKDILARVRLSAYEQYENDAKVTEQEPVNLQEEEPMEIAFTMSQQGNPKLVPSDKELARAYGKVENAKLFGRGFRGVFLALVGLPSAGQDSDKVGYLRWTTELPVGMARREMTCEAYPLQGDMVIVGKNLGKQQESATPASESEIDRGIGLPEKLVAIFRDGKITSAEYRASFFGRSMVVRIRERR